jgi:signal transduction histidine kinase
VITHDGGVLADVDPERPLCSYLNTLQDGARQCAATVSSLLDLEPSSETVVHPCFTGAVYRIVPLSCQGRSLGRFIVGPYVPANQPEPPRSLLSVADGDAEILKAHYERMPRISTDVAVRLCDHFKQVIELLVFQGHRAQLDELKAMFLATVSHELRTPLTSIIGYTEMLESGAVGDLSEPQREFLQTIRTKADELLALISTLLDLGQLEANGLKLQRESVDPRALLSAVGSSIVPAANRRNITLDLQIADGTPKMLGDPVRLRQIVLNLANNAVKFSDEDGTVTLSAEPGELATTGSRGTSTARFAATRPAVVVSVRDTGIGIEESEIGRIFDRFYQVDAGTTRAHGGAGLGLSIVKRLVEGHEGTIEVTSEPGRGTLFTVRIPAANDDE